MPSEDRTDKDRKTGDEIVSECPDESPPTRFSQESGECTSVCRDGGTSELLDPSIVDRPQAVRLSDNGRSTETIELDSLFTADVTDSGSFDIKGEIWKTTFGRVLQALPIATLLVEPGLTVAVANEACKAISPDYERILGSPFCNLFPTENGKNRARSVIQSVFSDRKPRVLSGMLHLCDKRVWVRASLRSIRIMTERFVLVLLENLTRETEQLILNQKQQKELQREITERKHSEEALTCSETRFRQIYDKAPLMMLSLGRDRVIRNLNAKCLLAMGYSQQELLGRKIDMLFGKESRAPFFQTFDSLWSTREIQDFSSRFLRKNGTQFEALVDGVVMEDPAWGPVGLLTVRDVTHELLLEKQLREAHKMEAVGTLAGGVAHDFNNLLQVMFGYAELVMMRLEKGSPNYQGLRTIRDAAQRGSELVKQVLTFSRRVESHPRALDLNHELEKVSQLLERTIPKMIAIDLNLAEALSTIFADPVQIEQIVLNLAVNAKDAMHDGGRLTIETENVSLDEKFCRQYPEVPPGDYVCLKISDTGHGMERDVLEHIFEPFFSTKKPWEGTGLGLSSVFGLVKMHGGHIKCESRPGHGTTFQIYFPAIEQQVGWADEFSGEMPAFGTETVLVIDDEEFLRAMVMELLGHAGYTVLDAGNGRDGLRVYKEKKNEISLVILDLIMPEMGGKQCLEGLLQFDPNAKVVIASGFPVDQKTKSFLEKRAKGFISKPFRAKELLSTVRRTLDRA